MTIEDSTLNNDDTLPVDDAALLGGTGDGNDPALPELEQGYTALPAPPTAPHWLPQNADDGETYGGIPTNGGFAGRPHGWER